MLGIVLPNLMEKLHLDKAQAATFFMLTSLGLLVAARTQALGGDPLRLNALVAGSVHALRPVEERRPSELARVSERPRIQGAAG